MPETDPGLSKMNAHHDVHRKGSKSARVIDTLELGATIAKILNVFPSGALNRKEVFILTSRVWSRSCSLSLAQHFLPSFSTANIARETPVSM